MNVLREIKNCRQVRGELHRRWFSSDELDLIVWCDDAGAPAGFQFCYPDGRIERALTWGPREGYTHATVDDGESDPGIRYKQTPVLNSDGPIDFPRLQRLFAEAGSELPSGFADFVAARLTEPTQLPRS